MIKRGRRIGSSRLAILLVGVLLATRPVVAQYFGQNKVPGPTRTWRILVSPHFDLYFHEDMRPCAEEALRLAERGYARLSRLYAHEVRERIPLILYASQSEFRETRAVSSLIGEGTGGLTEVYKHRVIVPATGSFGELEHVLTHETAHAMQFDILQRGSRGRSVEPLSWTPPLWVMEGLSEYLSVPGVDTQTETWLRDAVREGTLPDLRSLGEIADLRVYRFGQSAVAYIAQRFGDEALGMWLRAMARHRSVERGTAEGIGMTLEKLSADWQASLRARFLVQSERPADESESLRRLTDHSHGLANFYILPAVSPNGGEMVYIADETPYADLYLASAVDGGHRRRLIRGERRETFESLRYLRTSVDWAPDGDRIALVARSGGRDRLIVFDVRTRRVLRSFEFGLDEMISPAWSPDGGQLAFVGLQGGLARLYTVTAAGESLRVVTTGEAAAFQPDWSPDGKRIAFVTDLGYATRPPALGDAFWKIAVVDLRSGGVELLPDVVGKGLCPQWFPNGRHLLYVSDRTGVPNLFVRDLVLGCDYQLTEVSTGVVGLTPTSVAASLAANGHRVVFSVFEESGWNLYALKEPLLGIAGREPLHGVPVDSVVAQAVDTLGGGAGVAVSAEDSTASDMDELNSVAEVLEEPLEVDLGAVLRETASLPESLDVHEEPYRPRLSLDYVFAGGLYATGYGAMAQTVLAFSDMLGHRQLYVGADVNGSLEEGDYFLGYLNQKRRPALGFSLYQYVIGYGYGSAPGYPMQYQKRLTRGAGVMASYPLSHFRRVELSIDGVQERRYDWRCEEIDPQGLWACGWRHEHRDRAFVAPQMAFVHDSALFGSTGPLSGRRARIASSVLIGQRSARTLEIDHRVYWNIRKRCALAWRVVMAGEWGPDREPLAFGGPYSLHGYTDRPISGTQIAFTNLELRFPFVDRLEIAWPLRLGVYGIRGAAFFDLGGAWDDPEDFRAVRSGKGEGSFRLEDLRAACGLRVAVNIGFAVVRWDLSRTTDLSRWLNEPHGEFSVGWEF